MRSQVVTHVFEGLDKYQEAIEKVRSPPVRVSVGQAEVFLVFCMCVSPKRVNHWLHSEDDMIKAVVKPWPESRKRSRE